MLALITSVVYIKMVDNRESYAIVFSNSCSVVPMQSFKYLFFYHNVVTTMYRGCSRRVKGVYRSRGGSCRFKAGYRSRGGRNKEGSNDKKCTFKSRDLKTGLRRWETVGSGVGVGCRGCSGKEGWGYIVRWIVVPAYFTVLLRCSIRALYTRGLGLHYG